MREGFWLVAESKLTPQLRALDQSIRRRRSRHRTAVVELTRSRRVSCCWMVHVWGVQTYCAAEPQPCATSENVGSRCLSGAFEQASRSTHRESLVTTRKIQTVSRDARARVRIVGIRVPGPITTDSLWRVSGRHWVIGGVRGARVWSVYPRCINEGP